MLLAACEQFLSKTEEQIQQVALETLEGHQRAIMGSMTVEVRLVSTRGTVITRGVNAVNN